MNISMWNLVDWLKDYKVKCYIREGNDTIQSIQLLTEEELKKDVVYLDGSLKIPNAGMPTTTLVHGHDIIQVETENIDEIFNQIIQALEYYKNIENKLETYVSDENGLQKILDEFSSLMDEPAVICNLNGQLLSYSRQFAPDIHWHWKELLDEKGRITDERFQYFKNVGNFTKVYADQLPTLHKATMQGTELYAHCTINPSQSRGMKWRM